MKLIICIYLIVSFVALAQDNQREDKCPMVVVDPTSCECALEPYQGNNLVYTILEKPEGFCIDSDEGPLNIQGFNKTQIDNEDTYLALIEIGGIDPLSEEVISRKFNQPLNEDLRSEIIKRLSGSFEETPSDNFKDSFNKYLYELSFTPELKKPIQIDSETKRKKVQFGDLMNINQGSLKKSLVINNESLNFNINLYSQNPELNEFHNINYSFQIQANDDWTELKLTNNQHELVCKNKNYLKLICSDDKLHIAFSMEEEEHRKIRYKIIRLISDKIPAQIPRQFVIPHTLSAPADGVDAPESLQVEDASEDAQAEITLPAVSGNIQYHAEHYQGLLKRVQKQ